MITVIIVLLVIIACQRPPVELRFAMAVWVLALAVLSAAIVALEKLP